MSLATRLIFNFCAWLITLITLHLKEHTCNVLTVRGLLSPSWYSKWNPRLFNQTGEETFLHIADEIYGKYTRYAVTSDFFFSPQLRKGKNAFLLASLNNVHTSQMFLTRQSVKCCWTKRHFVRFTHNSLSDLVEVSKTSTVWSRILMLLLGFCHSGCHGVTNGPTLSLTPGSSQMCCEVFAF